MQVWGWPIAVCVHCEVLALHRTDGLPARKDTEPNVPYSLPYSRCLRAVRFVLLLILVTGSFLVVDKVIPNTRI